MLNVLDKILSAHFQTKVKIEHISASIAFSFYIVCFNFMPSHQGLSKYIEAKLKTILPLTYIKLFKKPKRGLELISLPHFRHDF